MILEEELGMIKKSCKAKWLHLYNKMLSGLLALMGFGSCSDEDEVNEIVPMYGMPASIYKAKDKSAEVASDTMICESGETYILNTLNERKNHAV
ncbi:MULTISPECIES: hypothetical protein [unclassified Bacteroides]|uniref:hypothetical protein n=1 Tax=unclassified Bacteroides TaxID=2646097 RepID=UPI000E9113F1|nr:MULTISPECIES: hypothetical protein [unclassified Bacteroides]RGN47076.1 hypothetical protein DXB63_09890 [Bacteroides sp. OM05-12]RHR77368.1 hypothetical protein DWW69_05865 [Bacteroides sp. AF16-49]